MKKYLLLTCFSVFSIFSAQAQWVQAPGPEGGGITAITSTRSAMLACSSGAGIYRSTDGGNTWTLVDPNETVIEAFLPLGDTVLALEGTDSIIRSNDGGISWQPVGSVGNGFPCFNLILNAGDLFTTSYSDVSDSAGFLVSTWTNIYRSTNLGRTWDTVSSVPLLKNSGSLDPFAPSAVSILADLNGTFLLANDSSIYRSMDHGVTWQRSANGIPMGTSLSSLSVNGQLAAAGNSLSGITTALFVSSDGGVHWQAQHTGMPLDTGVLACTWVGSDLLVSTPTAGVFRMSGGNWTRVDTTDYVSRFSPSGTTILSASGSGLLRSIDNGRTWSAANKGMYAVGVSSIAASGTNVLAASYEGLFQSTDEGTSWNPVILPNAPPPQLYQPDVLGSDATSMMVARLDHLYRSTNNGATWQQLSSPQPGGRIHALASSGPLILAPSIFTTQGFGFPIETDSLFFSSDGGATWHNEVNVPNNGSAPQYQPIAIFGDTLFVVTDTIVARSFDNGASWVLSGLPFNGQIAFVSSITRAGGKIFLAGSNIFVSSDGGANWSVMPGSGPQGYPNLIFSADSNLFFVSDSSVWRSSDQGSSWALYGRGFAPQIVPNSMAISDRYMLVGTQFNSVWRRPLSDLSGVVNPMETLSLSLTNEPNPFSSQTTLHYSLPNASFVSIELYDALGRSIHTIYRGDENAGLHSITLNGAALPDGTYFVRVFNGDASATCRILKSSINSR